jgi:hypothetical protein
LGEKSMMEITIKVSDEIGRRLLVRANEAGKDVTGFMTEIAEREALGKMPRSLRELFAPVREEIQASGTTDEELTAKIDDAITEVRQAKSKERG